jgi:hypothetical protein
MTQFQQSAAVRTLDTTERAYPAPFLAIVAGLVAVLIALAAISFAVDALPSDAALTGYGDTTAGTAYAAGLNAAIKQHQLEAAAAAMQRPITSTSGQQQLESAQQLRDGWAGALVVRSASDPADGWEAAQIRHGQAMRDFVERVATPE